MFKWAKGKLSRVFKIAAAVAVVALGYLARTTQTKWSGNEGLQEKRIYEPLLDFTPIDEKTVVMEAAMQTVTRGSTLVSADAFLHCGDDFSVRRIEFDGHDGQRQEAYLSLPGDLEEEGIAAQKQLPLVIVFPILSGEGAVSEVVSKSLVRRGFAVLRMEGYTLNLDQTNDVQEIMDKFRYAITDARALARYVQDLPEIDDDKLAVAGFSLGSILSATMMGVDEEVDAGAFVVGGGGISEILYDSNEESVQAFRDYLLRTGIASADKLDEVFSGKFGFGKLSDLLRGKDMPRDTISSFTYNYKKTNEIKDREDFIKKTRPYTAPFDPSRYAGSLEPCRTMIVSGRGDKIIPKDRTEELWERLGRPDWHEVPGGHKPVLHFYWIMDKIADHLDEVLNTDSCDDCEAGQATLPQKQDDLPAEELRQNREAIRPRKLKLK